MQSWDFTRLEKEVKEQLILGKLDVLGNNRTVDDQQAKDDGDVLEALEQVMEIAESVDDRVIK